MDTDGLPRDHSDKQIELVLRRDFEASDHFARAVYMWALADSDLPKELKDKLKTIPLATAFMSDASLDTFQMSSRAMAFSLTVRQNMGLHSWNADPSVHSKVALVPFKGVSLFRDV